MRRATANILVTLKPAVAQRRLTVLTALSDVLALQEMPRARDESMARLGRLVKWGPLVPARQKKPSTQPADRGWTFHRARIGGAPVGVRDSLGERSLSCKAVALVGPGRVDPMQGRRTLLSPSWCTVLKSRRADGSIVKRYNIHLTASVQIGKRGYRSDNPKRVARHKKERAKLERLVARDLKRGYDVEVFGDSNFHHMPVPGLLGWWAINDNAGTLGDRAIDGIWTSRKPESVRFLGSLVAGEHRHVIATWP